MSRIDTTFQIEQNSQNNQQEVAAAQEGDPFHPSDETDRLTAAAKLVKIAVARQMINFIQIARPFFRLKNGFANGLPAVPESYSQLSSVFGRLRRPLRE